MSQRTTTVTNTKSRNINVILDIPSHLRSSILAEWLEVNDLARLDVAIVKGSLRHEYLSQLSHDRIALSGTPKISPQSNVLTCLRWLADRKLCVRSLKFSSTEAADEIRVVLQNTLAINGLEEIEFEKLDGVDTSLFRNLIAHCQNISKINLSCCSSLTDNYFQGTQNTSTTTQLAIRDSNETTQDNAGIHFSTSSTVISTDQEHSSSPLSSPRLVLPNLRQLLLNNCSSLTDAGIQSIVQLAPQLSKLHCRAIHRLTDESLHHISSLPHLEDIDFGLCRLMTDKGVRQLAQSKNRAILSSVNFYYCRNISDQSISELTLHHPSIQMLNVSGCHLVTDVGVARVATQCREHLLHLNLAGCAKITPNSIAIVASNCRQLRSINLSNIKSINDNCVESLWRNCEQLEMLCFSNCELITDDAFKHRSFMWSHLKHLDLTYCNQVGDTGLLQIATFCPSLRMLRMTGCKLSLPCLRRATSMNEHLHINIEQE